MNKTRSNRGISITIALAALVLSLVTAVLSMFLKWLFYSLNPNHSVHFISVVTIISFFSAIIIVMGLARFLTKIRREYLLFAALYLFFVSVYSVFFHFGFSIVHPLVPNYNQLKVLDNGMAPTFFIGDRVFIKPIKNHQEETITRASIVVFRTEKYPGVRLVARVIGIYGDTVELHDRNVYIRKRKILLQELPDSQCRIERLVQELADGFEFRCFKETLDSSSYHVIGNKSGPFRFNVEPVVVTKDKYYVLSDNRDHGKDSRDFGLLSKEQIISIVVSGEALQ